MGIELVITAITDTPPGVTCQEDMSCWNPSTMGNGQSGPGVWVVTLPNGDSFLVVLSR